MSERRTVTQEELRTQIDVAIRTMPKLARKLLVAKLPLERDKGADMLADHILAGMAHFEITAPPIPGIPFEHIGNRR